MSVLENAKELVSEWRDGEHNDLLMFAREVIRLSAELQAEKDGHNTCAATVLEQDRIIAALKAELKVWIDTTKGYMDALERSKP